MPPRGRKRNRKRKRRNVSFSSSSLSSSSSEGERPTSSPTKAPPAIAEGGQSDSDSDASSSSSSSSSSSASSARPAEPAEGIKLGSVKQLQRHPPSRSPSPPDTAMPTLISPNPTTDAEKEKEKALKERFRKFWMASIADGFKDDLEQIRKEPNMTTSRLSVLIDALASGADVFSSVAQSGSRNLVNEMEVVLGPSTS